MINFTMRPNQFLFFIGCLLAFGCNEDEFLDRTPFDRFTPNNFFETEEQIAQATTAIYPVIRNLYTGALFSYGELRSDNTTFEFDRDDRGRIGTEEIDYFLLNPSSGLHGNIYNPLYQAIARANYVIDQIEDVPFAEEADRLAREGEARFARGLCYFLLTQHFGATVIVTDPLTDDGTSLIGLQRSPVEEVYSQIIVPDLTFAIENLPEVWGRLEVGRATQGAARMALAKAYFARNDYTAALPLLNDLIASGTYRLLDNYADVFAGDNPNNAEIIFAGQFNSVAGQGAGFMLNWIPDSGADITDGPFRTQGAFNIPTCSLLEAYEEGDRRFENDYAFYTNNRNEVIPYSTKYLELPFPTQGGINVDFPIFRYADALLMQAEADVEVNGGLPNQAFETLNALRARAGLPFFFPGNPVPELDIQDTESLRQAIRQERRLELAYENHRSYDLRRYGNFVETMQAHGQVQKEKQFFLDDLPEAYTNIRELLAIPNTQVELYNYEQNPGWN